MIRKRETKNILSWGDSCMTMNTNGELFLCLLFMDNPYMESNKIYRWNKRGAGEKENRSLIFIFL